MIWFKNEVGEVTIGKERRGRVCGVIVLGLAFVAAYGKLRNIA